MASFENAETITMLAGADFSARLFQLVRVSDTLANTAVLVQNVNHIGIGVIGEAVLADAELQVVLLKGRIKMDVGTGDATVGDIVVNSTDDGKITTVADIATLVADSMAYGIALESGVDGDVIEVLAYPLMAHSA